MTIFVVSGLRRSGTSMMMHILKEGGIPILDDNPNNGDKFNPNGYFEWNTIMHNMQHPEIFRKCDGMVVKIIASTIINAPNIVFFSDKEFKVIWMERNIREAVKSWKIRAGKTEEYDEGAVRYAQYKKDTAYNWLKKQKNIKIINVNYSDVLYYPEREIKKIQKFLEIELDIKKAIKVVNLDLYKIRL